MIGPVWLLGNLADRFGYRVVAISIFGLLVPCFVLVLSFPCLIVWYIAYGLYAIAVNLAGTILGNICVELVRRVEPSLLLSTGTTILLPLAIVTTLISGRLGDAQDSYLFSFAIAATLSAVAGLSFLLLATEPRTGRLYVVKTTPR